MKVYVILQTDWDYGYVHAVLATREAAEAYIAAGTEWQRLHWEIVEQEVRDQP